MVQAKTPRGAIMGAFARARKLEGVSESEFFHCRKHQPYCALRHEVWLWMHQHGWPYTQIARFFDKDHTSIMHGVSVAASRPPVTCAEEVLDEEFRKGGSFAVAIARVASRYRVGPQGKRRSRQAAMEEREAAVDKLDALVLSSAEEHIG